LLHPLLQRGVGLPFLAVVQLQLDRVGGMAVMAVPAGGDRFGSGERERNAEGKTENPFSAAHAFSPSESVVVVKTLSGLAMAGIAVRLGAHLLLPPDARAEAVLALPPGLIADARDRRIAPPGIRDEIGADLRRERLGEA